MWKRPFPRTRSRLALLKACRIMYTPAEEAFDDVARLAAELCGAGSRSSPSWTRITSGSRRASGVDAGGDGEGSVVLRALHHRPPRAGRRGHADGARFADKPLVTAILHPLLRRRPTPGGEGSAVGACRSPIVRPRRPHRAATRVAAPPREADLRELRLRRESDRSTRTVPPWPSPGEAGHRRARWRVANAAARGQTPARSSRRARPAASARRSRCSSREWRDHEQIVGSDLRARRGAMRLTTPHVGKLLDVGNLGSRSTATSPYLGPRVPRRHGSDRADRGARGPGAVPRGVAGAPTRATALPRRTIWGRPSRSEAVERFLAETGEWPSVESFDSRDRRGRAVAAQLGEADQSRYLSARLLYVPRADDRPRTTSTRAAISGPWARCSTRSSRGSCPSRARPISRCLPRHDRPPLPLRAHVSGVPQAAEGVLLKCLGRRRARIATTP